MPLIVDSHCHLDFPVLADDLDSVLARAAGAGVGLMVTISTRVRQFARVRAIAEAHDNVYCTIGTHPHNAGEEGDVTVDELVRMAEHPKVVAIGESGLDYHYDNAPRAAQAASFRIHIAAARLTSLPLIVHSRAAENDTAAILEQEMVLGAFTPVLHCFSSRRELAERGLAVGAYVSFSGIVTFKNADDLRATARLVPEDRLLVETDAPYLAPEPVRGRTNEPANTMHTLRALASARAVDPEHMARVTSDNFFRLFTKAARPAAFGVEQ